MIALVRYTMAVLLHSQRFLPPLVLFFGVSLMFLLTGDGEPVLGTYSAVAGATFVCSVWLTISLAAAEDPARRAVTAVNAGGARPVLVATVLAAMVSCLVASGLVVSLPLLVGRYVVTPADLAVGFLAQCTAVGAGVALGLISSRLVLRRVGPSLFVALILVLTFTLVDGVPPVNPVLHLLASGSTAPVVLPATAAHAGIALVLLAVSTTVTQHLAQRRN